MTFYLYCNMRYFQDLDLLFSTYQQWCAICQYPFSISQNILIKWASSTSTPMAIVADFGLAHRMPHKNEILPQVGSPYWMSPECLKGQFYDRKVAINSLIIQIVIS